jgi:dTDP-4-dehydrorhamnose reductase
VPFAISPFLVIGRSGQLATDLMEAADTAGLTALAAGRPEFDLADPDAPSRLIDRVKPRAVINAAAYTAVDKAESEPEAAMALNRDAPGRLARACAAAGVPFIHISTDQVFDGRKAGGYIETDPVAPLCVYGRSKLEGEEAVMAADANAMVVRVSWVFGPSGNNFVARILDWARANPTLRIVCDQRGRPTWSPGLARALFDLAARMGSGDSAARPRGLLHLAGGSVMTRDQQARLVMEASRARGGPFAQIVPVPTSEFPTPAIRPLNAELDCTLARTRHGLALGPFEPDLEETLDRLLGPRLSQKD